MLDMAGGKMYWTDSGTEKIQRANLDGSNIENIVTGVEAPNGIALDVAGGKMYWTVWMKIQRADLDGQNIEDLVESYIEIIGTEDLIEEYVSPYGIVLDVAGGKMYWTEKWPNKIQRANLDGSNIEAIFTGEPLHGIALDVAGGKVYWTDRDDGMNRILRMNLDGSLVEELFTPRRFEVPHDVALDVAGGKVYWTARGFDMYWTARGRRAEDHKIQRANLDGSNVENLVTRLRDPGGIALNLSEL